MNRRLSLSLCVLGLIAFALIAADVHFHGWLQRLDTPALAWCGAHEAPWLLLAASGYSLLGNRNIIAAAALFVGLHLARAHRRRDLVIGAIGILGCPVLNLLLKNIFHIPRPADALYGVFSDVGGYAFPSGHAMGAAITAGLIVLMLPRTLPRARRRAWSLLALLIALLEGPSLVYLRVHTPSDILGAWAISVAWLAFIRLLLAPAQPALQTVNS